MKRLVPWRLLLAAWCALPFAAPAQAPARTPNVRYLFIIDHSAGLSKLAQNTQATVFEMLATGFYGQARAGEIFGVWTFNDTVDQRALPLQTWLPELNHAIATRTAKFVQSLQYRRSPRLDRAVADMLDAIKLCDSLVVFLISDGADVVVGTPFDRPINITYGHRLEELRLARRPFVTTFVSHRGEIVDWSVTAGGEKIVIPLGPIAAQLAAMDFLAAPVPGTTGVTAEISPAPVAPVLPAPVVFSAPRAADTHPSAATATVSFNSTALKVETSKPAEIPPLGQPPEVALTAVAPPVTVVLSASHADGPAILPAPGAAEVTSAPAEKAEPLILPAPEVSVVPPPPVDKWPWLVGGLGVLALAAFFILPQIRRTAIPNGPSLITHSLERKGK